MTDPVLIPIEITLIIGFYAMLATFVIMVARYDVINNLKLLMLKKNGAKLVVHITQDSNVYWDVQLPSKERDKPQVMHDGKKQDWNTKAQLFAMRYGVPGALCLTGQSEIYNPFKNDKLDPYTAENIEQVAAYAELKGRLGVEKKEEKMEKLLMFCLLAAAAGALLSFINMQAIGDMSGAVQGVAANMGSILEAVQSIPRVL